MTTSLNGTLKGSFSGSQGGMSPRPAGISLMIPKLRMNGIFLNKDGGELLRSARDALCSARMSIATSRTARMSDSGQSQLPEEMQSPASLISTIKHLREQLQEAEEATLQCAETGMGLLNKIHGLEDELEDKNDQIATLTQQTAELESERKSLMSALQHYKTGKLYMDETIRREIETVQAHLASEEQNLEREKEESKWMETRALQQLQEAQYILNNAPQCETDEIANRMLLSKEEEDEWMEKQRVFINWCVKDATLLHKASQKWAPVFQTPRIEPACDSYETLVLKQSDFLKIWRPRVMRLTLSEYRIDFIGENERLRGSIDLTTFQSMELNVVPPPKQSDKMSVQRTGEGRSWDTVLTLTSVCSSYNISFESDQILEEWLNRLQRFVPEQSGA
eukprot:TRINITY_DN19509_c0_g1_i1.p1 TRINITY_DN19509_c0_g1~~TRINITY_DN19509_c0_g1_i1.p1  ORF type:complete len:394 (+),score=76.05 TRINITY_DN19509_c0_g1_i1:39-1220(+)